MFSNSLKCWLAASVAAIPIMLASIEVRAQQTWTLHQEFPFQGNGFNGAIPLSGNLLIAGTQIYGETYSGGVTNDGGLSTGDAGTIYHYTTASPGTPDYLYGFSGPDGAYPSGGLVQDAQGNLYGTTAAGGANNLGTVFKLSPSGAALWTLTTLHSFALSDGATPLTGVTLGPDGALYGTTWSGGFNQVFGSGVVFKLNRDGTGFRVMAEFEGYTNSLTNVAVDPQGNVIGTTYNTDAPRGAGSLFKVTPSGQLSIVVDFLASETPFGTSTGHPIGNLVRDSAGNVYGVLGSVAHNDANGLSIDQGAGVFKVAAVTHQLSIRAFLPGVTVQSGVVRDAAGNLYGTTVDGGTSSTGSVFAVSATGALSSIASLPIGNLAPSAGVVLDASGKLWGTSSAGGVKCSTSSNVTPTGCGTLFSLSH